MPQDKLYKRIPQDNHGTQGAEDERMAEVANWLRGGHQTGTAELDGHELPPSPHGITLPEHRATRQYAMTHGVWFNNDSKLDVMGSSGDENHCYYNQDGSIVYKVNMLTHSGKRILSVFEKVIIHNQIFPETRYTFIGSTNMGYTRSAFRYSASIMCRTPNNSLFPKFGHIHDLL